MEKFPSDRVTQFSSRALQRALELIIDELYLLPPCLQGARQDQICVSGVSNFIHENTHKSGSTYSVINMSAIVEAVSTEADAGNTQLD